MKIVFLLSFILTSSFVLAQTKTNGTVVDENGVPLAGVIIKVKDTSTGKMTHFASTDANGYFTVDVSGNHYLEFSLLGFSMKRINKIPSGENMKVVMKEEAIKLKEIAIKADKVRMNGDTISYNIGTYADGRDHSLGDVIARIPGFEVQKETGKITYEGHDISKFYIEGLDMLDNKYGIATNTLPQVDVSSVEVMKHHQPVRMLEDFTYTDNIAVNIKMKENAKSRWVSSFNTGAGYGDKETLWKLETLGLRLKKSFQTMLTYKTNNTGENVSRETSSLINFDDLDNDDAEYIKLDKPSTPALKSHRSLFNRSHSLAVNMLKKLSETSQINLQVIYNNERDVADGHLETTYYLPEGERNINNQKEYKLKGNKLSALLKYENNTAASYLKNSLTADLSSDREWLDETGTNTNNMYAKTSFLVLKENLYVARRFGNRIISFYSNNLYSDKSPELQVDIRHQHISQRQLSTNTYATGGMLIGPFSLTMECGIKARFHSLETSATGLSDTLGINDGKSRFWSADIYVKPSLLYKTRDISFEICPAAEYVYDKYSHAVNASSRFLLSPSASLRWYVTPQLRLSLSGDMSTQALDASRFYNTLVIQDLQYISLGYGGYDHADSKSIRGGIKYDNALKALHVWLNVSRTFTSSPYMPTRNFIDNYIIVSAVRKDAKSDVWRGNASLSKGLNLWNGIFNLSVSYMHNNATLMQDGQAQNYNTGSLTLKTGFDFSFYEGMHIVYNLNFVNSRMKSSSSESVENINNWLHSLTLKIPVKAFMIEFTNDYYRNGLAGGQHKNFLLTDAVASYKHKRMNLKFEISNIFNNRTFAYTITDVLMRMSSSNSIRGRNLLLSMSFDL